MLVGKVQSHKDTRFHLHDKQRVHSVALLSSCLPLVILEVCTHAWHQGVGTRLELVVSSPLTEAEEPSGLHSEPKLHEIVHHYEALIHCRQ